MILPRAPGGGKLLRSKSLENPVRSQLQGRPVCDLISWVPLPDVAKVRSSLNLPACRKFAGGTDFYTLPIIEDPTTYSFVRDSFGIAVHLQSKYPNSGAGDLFPPRHLTTSSNKALRAIGTAVRASRENVDAAFTALVQLMVHDLLFDPATAKIGKAEFVRRAGVRSWEDFSLVGEAQEKMKISLRNMLGDLTRLLVRATYADFIVGWWLRMMCATLLESEWEEVRS
ncbi:hypothetical protein ACJ73_02811 [Blastomyces percursus]|uniref:GST N-terminal domain-containing protein n=1 Tax=Blastomyces percursus TaxID=1658174 RepID=A0A1J9R053_9EURO|nr:hypothetical protein ACJ73_02811 [Blastomyces percursus]